ncbi:hypothetical protein STANM309S_01759 [Streptomyces tanashiensis]
MSAEGAEEAEGEAAEGQHHHGVPQPPEGGVDRGKR